jgi:protocatechuate 3,4-dioxygenase beta subunit
MASPPSYATLISGHVTDTGNVPLVGATVEVSEIIPDPHFDASTTTDGSGNYQIDVPDGFPYVAASDGGHVSQTQRIQLNGSAQALDFSLTLDGSIAGTIRATTPGNPVLANASVTLLDAQSQSEIDQTTTASDGSYSFSALTPGEYAVCVTDPSDVYIDACYDGMNVPASGVPSFTTIDLAGAQNLTGIDLNLDVGATVSGTLRDRYFNTPIAEAPIDLTLYSSSQNQVATLSVTTDANGGYILPGLAPGSYYLEAGRLFQYGLSNTVYTSQLYGGGECSGQCPFATGTLIQVSASGARGIDLDLFPGYVVTGRVTDAMTGQGIAGVTINTCDTPSQFQYQISGIATTNANGDYTVAHTAGDATYIAAINAPGYFSAIWPSTTTDSANSCLNARSTGGTTLSFTTPDEVLSNINFGLSPGGSISGTVSASDLPGEPIAASLDVFSTDGQSEQWVATIHSNGNGDYQSPGLAPGSYYIAAYYDNVADCQMYDAQSCGAGWLPENFDFSSATAIQVIGTQVQSGIDLQLKADIFHNSFGN